MNPFTILLGPYFMYSFLWQTAGPQRISSSQHRITNSWQRLLLPPTLVFITSVGTSANCIFHPSNKLLAKQITTTTTTTTKAAAAAATITNDVLRRRDRIVHW